MRRSHSDGEQRGVRRLHAPGTPAEMTASFTSSNPSILIRVHGTAHTPGFEGVGLSVAGHAGIEEAVDPRVQGILGIRRRRSVEVVRVGIDKGMAGRPGGTRFRHGRIVQGRQLGDGGESPAHPTPDTPKGTADASISPHRRARTRRPLPDELGFPVQDRLVVELVQYIKPIGTIVWLSQLSRTMA